MKIPEFNDVIEKICDAAQKVDPEYVKMPVAESEARYKERVYAYELYHQFREANRDTGKYRLNAEVPKKGNQSIKTDATPDLLFHHPGNKGADANILIVEVKHTNFAISGMEKDLEILSEFVHTHKYNAGMYLIYGAEKEKIKVATKKARELEQADGEINLSNIFLYWHNTEEKTVILIDWFFDESNK